MDEETRRLKNRIRQQQYRARKRLEKTLGNNQTSEKNRSESPEEDPALVRAPPVLSLPKPTNGCLVLKPHQSSLVNEAGKEVGLQDAIGSVCAVLPQVPPDRVLVLSNPFFAGNIRIGSLQNPGPSNAAIAAPTFQIIQPLPTMNGNLNFNVPRECTDRDANALLVRRQKNRDRQRRYRARKRLEADIRNGHFRTQNLLDANGQQPFISSVNLANRVYCSRDWKRDARLASSQTEQDSPSNDSSKEEQVNDYSKEEQVSEHDVDDTETTSSVGSRRN